MVKIDGAAIAAGLAVPGRSDHKYTRGVVLAATGSPTYPGAAVLSVAGAQAGGVGIVGYSGPQRCEDLVLSAAPEVVIDPGRVDAALVGSGWDSSMVTFVEALVRECASRSVPVIVDAGAIAGVKEWAQQNPLMVATPHVGEAARMLTQFSVDASPPQIAADIPTYAQQLADLSGAIIVLKGADTAVAAPGEVAHVFTAPSAWGAVAGAGDVLAGLIGALVAGEVARRPAAQPTLLVPAVAAAVGLHGLAASQASGVVDEELSLSGQPGHPVTALQVAAAVPSVIGQILWKGSAPCIS